MTPTHPSFVLARVLFLLLLFWREGFVDTLGGYQNRIKTGIAFYLFAGRFFQAKRARRDRKVERGACRVFQAAHLVESTRRLGEEEVHTNQSDAKMNGSLVQLIEGGIRGKRLNLKNRQSVTFGRCVQTLKILSLFHQIPHLL